MIYENLLRKDKGSSILKPVPEPDHRSIRMTG